MNLYNIPRHKNCNNCGMCCGLIPATHEELNDIHAYIKANKIKPIKHPDKLTCPFRDDKKKRCNIYPVRPTICRLMGVTKGMHCPNGNTCEIDGSKFIPNDISTSKVINFIEW